MILSRSVFVLILASLPVAAAAAQHASEPVVAQQDRAARLLAIERSLLVQMDRLNKQLAPHGASGSLAVGDAAFQEQLGHDPSSATTRDLTNASLLILRTGGAPVSAEMLLRRVFTVQDMDRSSRDFGMLPWQLNAAQIQDPNAIEFGMQALGAVFLGYGGKLSAGFRKDADAHLRAALVALANHRVKVSYTNIFLMNTMDTIELGEYLNDPDAIRRGELQWKQWVDYTAASGVHEFDSPTYYAVDLGDLVLGFLYVKNGAIHRQIEAALNMFWRDIAANYLNGAGHLAGAHSRDYYPLTGRGGLEYYLYLEGLLPQPVDGKFADVFLEKVDLLESERPGGYRVPQSVLDLAKLPERVVEQRWDEDPTAVRYTYLTQRFAMGFATGRYSDQDKMFAADLAGNPSLDSITLVPDVLDSPYGLIKAKDKSGHMKPTHLALNLSGVQEKGTALLVVDLDPKTAVDNPTFATNLILPSGADEIYFDDKIVKVSPTLDEASSETNVIGVRAGDACFAARIVSIDTLNGEAPRMRLRADKIGLAHAALRLAIYHATSPFSTADIDHLHIALLLSMASCDGRAGLAAQMHRLREARCHSEESDGGWSGVADLGELRLELREDPATRRNASSSVNGHAMSPAVFSVNGRAMGLTTENPANDRPASLAVQSGPSNSN